MILIFSFVELSKYQCHGNHHIRDIHVFRKCSEREAITIKGVSVGIENRSVGLSF